jgi:hypothetical protein
MSKNCKAKGCGVPIRWHTVPNKNGVGYWVDDITSEKHLCVNWIDPRAQTKTEDVRLNSTINDLKSDMSYKFTSVEDRLDSMQRIIISQNSLLVEVKAKLDMALRA